MNKKFAFITIGLLSLVILILSSCATTPFEAAGEAYDQGNYGQAIEKALEALEEEPGMAEAEALLKESWQRANSDWTAEIATYEEADSPWEVGQAFTRYNNLIYIHNLAKEAGRMDLDPAPDPDGIYARAMETQQRVADMHVQEGSALLSSGQREDAREALEHFYRAEELIPEYPGLEAKVKRAKELGTVKVFVFTGPESDVTLNPIEMIDNLEQNLGKNELIEIVGPPSRYAAPIGDDHGARDFARGHGAEIMLHVDPETELTAKPILDRRPINSNVQADWMIEELSFVSSAEAQVRYQVIDLEADEVTDEGEFTVSSRDDSGFSVSAIIHSGVKKNLSLGGMSSPRQMMVNAVAPGVTDVTFQYQLSKFEDIDMPDISFGAGATPATYGTGEAIDLSRYENPSELARIKDLNGHTFFLFDVYEFDTYGDGNLDYRFSYSPYFGDGETGRLETAAYDRKLYSDIISWMSSWELRTPLRERFAVNFYSRTMAREVAEEIAPLL